MNKKTMVAIPGPTPIAESIKIEMARDIQAFGDPRFVQDYKSLIDDLHEMFGCDGQTFVIAGTGTLGMEMSIANSTKAGDNVLIITHGFFGDRFIEICERKGLNIDILKAEWGQTVPLSEIEAKLKEKDYAAMTVSHVDTATGVVADVAGIGKIMTNFPNTIYIVDGVCSSAAHYENLKEMNIDILFTGTQKAFGVCPGLMMLWASKKAVARRAALGMIPEYYIDFDKWAPIMDDPSKYFATPAVNLVWALKESVAIIKAEGGLKARAERHAKQASAIQKALEALGFKILANEDCRAITLSNAIYPEGIDDLEFRKTLIENGMIVAAGLGPYAGKLFRMGHMGNIEVQDTVVFLSTIERVLKKVGKLEKSGIGVGTYLDEIAK